MSLKTFLNRMSWGETGYPEDWADCISPERWAGMVRWYMARIALGEPFIY